MLVSVAASAQWLDLPAKGIPRLPNGKPNLSAPVPKKPDLTGTWMVPFSTLGEGGPPRYTTYLAADLPAGQVPLKPAAQALIRERLAGFGKDIPFSRCLPAGLPMANVYPAPFKIIQQPRAKSGAITVILYETRGAYRQIFADGRALPANPNPTWMGYSIGHWESAVRGKTKDVFVVESNGFNDKTWIDAIGHPHGEGLRLTERFHRRDFGHIDLQITIDDPEWYDKPWTVAVTLELVPDTELLEDVCLENERDASHLVGK